MWKKLCAQHAQKLGRESISMRKLVDKFKGMTLVQAVFVMPYGVLAIMWSVYLAVTFFKLCFSRQQWHGESYI